MHKEPPIERVSYSISQAVHATSLGKTTLYKLISDGTLRATRVGGRTVIPAESLLSLIGSRPASTSPSSSLHEREDK